MMLFSKRSNFEYYESIGDKILSKNEDSSEILIAKNRLHDILWGTVFVLIGISLFIYFGKYSFDHFDSMILLMLLLLSLPAFGLGIFYFWKSKNNLEYRFDTKSRFFYLNSNKKISFDKISEIKISSIEGIIHLPSSYQLNLFINNREVMLITSERLYLIQDAANFISEETNIRFNKKMYEA